MSGVLYPLRGCAGLDSLVALHCWWGWRFWYLYGLRKTDTFTNETTSTPRHHRRRAELCL